MGFIGIAVDGPGVAQDESHSAFVAYASDVVGLPGPRVMRRLTVPGSRDGSARIGLAGLGELVRALAGAEEVWRPLVRFSRGKRWFCRLDLAADYEVWLLSWLPGQCTGFHNHGEASGAFAVAKGQLRETLAAPGRRRVRCRTAAPGTVTRFGSGRVHDLGNVADEPAVSVHAYSPPLSAMRRYEMTASGLVLARTENAALRW